MEYIIEDIIIGRVYMIYNILTPMIYIGSTTTSLSTRWSKHLVPGGKGKGRVYKYMKNNGISNFRIKLLEWRQVNNLEELRHLEQTYIDKYNKNILLNDKRAFESDEYVRNQSKKRYQGRRKLFNKVFEMKIE